MKARMRKKMLVITLPMIDPPTLSRSGKRLLVASSRGFRRTALRFKNKPVAINVNASVHIDEQQDKKNKPELSKSKPLPKGVKKH